MGKGRNSAANFRLIDGFQPAVCEFACHVIYNLGRLIGVPQLMSEQWQIFRYRPINDFLWQELELAQFYCCSPLQLNDPFDCQIDWHASLNRALNSEAIANDRKGRLSTLRDMFVRAILPITSAGVCCFTRKADDPLMWSHYANSHRGVCLLYEIPDDYFMNRYDSDGDGAFFFVGGAPVRYESNAFYDWLVSGDLNSPHSGNIAENAISVLFTAKAPEWSHEEEWQIITRSPWEVGF